MLTTKFYELEGKEIVWGYGGEKSLIPYGFNFKFIKAFWNMMKKDLMRFLDKFHDNRVVPRGTSSSFMILIPKTNDPQANLFGGQHA